MMSQAMRKDRRFATKAALRGIACVVAGSLISGCGWAAAGLTALGIAASQGGGGGTPENPVPEPTGVDPMRGDNDKALTITISGRNFSSSCEVWLSAASWTVRGRNVAAAETWIRARFEAADLASRTGPVSIRVKNEYGENSLEGALRLSLPAPTFTGVYLPAPAGPQCIVALDFDGDGVLDLAIAGKADREIVILRGDGEGRFSESTRIPMVSAPLWMAVVEKEALKDAGSACGSGIVVASEFEVCVVACRREGAETEIEIETIWQGFDRAEGKRRVAMGAFDGDGKANDVVVTSEYEELQFILRDLGEGPGEPFGRVVEVINEGEVGECRVERQVSPVDLAIADFDGDGIDDIALVWKVAGNVVFFLGRKGGPPVPAAIVSVGVKPEAIAAGTLWDPQYRDEHPDIVVTKGSDEVKVLYVCGPGEEEGTLRVVKGQRSASVGREPEDVLLVELGGPDRCDAAGADCKGPPDIVVANRDSRDVSIAITPALDLGDALTMPVQGSPIVIAAGDFDGDRRTDLAALGTDPAAVTILRQEPEESTSPEALPSFYYAYGAEPTYPPGLVGLDPGSRGHGRRTRRSRRGHLGVGVRRLRTLRSGQDDLVRGARRLLDRDRLLRDHEDASPHAGGGPPDHRRQRWIRPARDL